MRRRRRWRVNILTIRFTESSCPIYMVTSVMYSAHMIVWSCAIRTVLRSRSECAIRIVPSGLFVDEMLVPWKPLQLHKDCTYEYFWSPNSTLTEHLADQERWPGHIISISCHHAWQSSVEQILAQLLQTLDREIVSQYTRYVLIRPYCESQPLAKSSKRNMLRPCMFL